MTRNKRLIQRNRELVQKLKKDKPCYDCGGVYPYYVMDYDHLDPKTKIAKISKLVIQTRSEKVILDEIAKCEIICSNCHRKRTHNRRKTK